MMDIAHKNTDKKIKKLESQIESVYQEALVDIDHKLNDFAAKYKVKEAIHLQELKDEKITQKQFDAWKKGQVFQGEQWEAKRDQIISTIHNSNSVATRIINGSVVGVFATNANYMSYSLEHDMGINFGFGVYDHATVVKLIKDNPDVLPKWKINEQKDYTWNKKKVNNAITQGIIQGERLDQITKRISQGLVAQNENTMKTFARTAMTGAQNAGRDQSLMDAKSKGINVVKQWMATLDGRTRDSHRHMDGETIKVKDIWHPAKFSNGCRYPGDPEGPAHEVYNCRCTMVGDVLDYPAEYGRYDNIDGKPIKNMTYAEWASAKKNGTRIEPWVFVQKKETITIVDSFQSRLGAVKSVAEVNDLMNSQGWWRDKEWGIEEADLTGCDLDSAKSIAASYQQVFEKYPQLIGKLDAPDAHPVGMGNNTYAWCYLRKFGKVQVNPNIYNDWSNISRKYEKDVESGWHPYATTAESIVTHEIGHAIDGLLARRGIAGGVTARGEYRLASSSLKSTIMKRAAKLSQDLADDMEFDKFHGSSLAIKRHVSRYATKNNKEWFAECFAEYITSANPRVVASEFGKELEKLIAKLK